MIMWRKGKGGAGMPLQIGYLGKLPVFHIFWNSFGSGIDRDKYHLDVSLPYIKRNLLFKTEQEAHEAASDILAKWLLATGLKEDDE